MNIELHNVKFKTAQYDIQKMLMKNDTPWCPRDNAKTALFKFLQKLADELTHGTPPVSLVIKVNKGGLALKGHGSLDCCWVDLRKDDAVVKWNDNLFKNKDKMAGQHRHVKIAISSDLDVCAAVNFAIMADKIAAT